MGADPRLDGLRPRAGALRPTFSRAPFMPGEKDGPAPVGPIFRQNGNGDPRGGAEGFFVGKPTRTWRTSGFAIAG